MKEVRAGRGIAYSVTTLITVIQFLAFKVKALVSVERVLLFFDDPDM